jgi:hypothetical protein
MVYTFLAYISLALFHLGPQTADIIANMTSIAYDKRKVHNAKRVQAWFYKGFHIQSHGTSHFLCSFSITMYAIMQEQQRERPLLQGSKGRVCAGFCACSTMLVVISTEKILLKTTVQYLVLAP